MQASLRVLGMLSFSRAFLLNTIVEVAMILIRLAWLCWLAAAVLLFSGTSGSGMLILLLVVSGFVLNLLAFVSALFGRK